MARQPELKGEYLTPAAVAAIFFVDPKTVTRWAIAGKLPAIRTPGGHRRFLRSDVMTLIDPVHAGHLTVPSLCEAVPGSPAAVVAAVIAEAAAVALEAEAELAGEAVARATSVLDTAHVEAARTASDARQARALATVHAAYAGPGASGDSGIGASGTSQPGKIAAAALPGTTMPAQRSAAGH
jgi:excisionase family DNA binding protein